jgi:hypothetical protein
MQFRQADEIAQSNGLSRRYALAQRSYSVISPAFIVQVRIGALVRLFDQISYEELIDRSIQCARAEVELAFGAL